VHSLYERVGRQQQSPTADANNGAVITDSDFNIAARADEAGEAPDESKFSQVREATPLSAQSGPPLSHHLSANDEFITSRDDCEREVKPPGSKAENRPS